MRTNHVLGAGLVSLGALIIVYAVLGPLVLDVIHFRTTASGLNQIRGGDLAALVVVAPVCMAVGWLAWHGHRAVPVLALAPAMFAMYMYSQLILGNEYLHLPGNVERCFPLLLAMFLIAAAIVLRCWGLTQPEGLPVSSRRLERGSGILLVVIAAFAVVGIHLPGLVDALRDHPSGAAYLAMPTTFWVVKFYDLGIVAPAVHDPRTAPSGRRLPRRQMRTATGKRWRRYCDAWPDARRPPVRSGRNSGPYGER